MATSLKIMNLMLILLGICLVFHSEVMHAKLTTFIQPTKQDKSLSFLVVGDWGRKGSFNQSLVASQVNIYQLLS